MAASNLSLIIIVTAAIILISVDTVPTCSYVKNEDRKLVCNPSDNEDYVVKKGLVSDSNNTLHIVMRVCNIIDIEKQAFENLFALESMDLSDNRIQNLQLGIFDGLRNLYMINLSNNLISNIPLGIFSQLANLRILNFHGNQLRSDFTRGVFDGLPSLYNLFLSHNLILGRDFGPFVTDRSNRIISLSMAGNDMSNAPDNLLHILKKLKQLYLEECSLTEVPKFATSVQIRSLVTLSMSSNRISRIDNPNTFNNLDKLEILTLSHNGLESVHENVFKGLKKLVDLRLENNKLKTLPETVFQNMIKLFTLNVAHNSIEYIPENVFKGSLSLRLLDITFNRFTYLTDKFFYNFKNSGSALLSVGFENNPWQCACLLEVINEMKSLNVKYYGYNGKFPACVTTAEFRCKRQREFNPFYVELYNLVKGGFI